MKICALIVAIFATLLFLTYYLMPNDLEFLDCASLKMGMKDLKENGADLRLKCHDSFLEVLNEGNVTLTNLSCKSEGKMTISLGQLAPSERAIIPASYFGMKDFKVVPGRKLATISSNELEVNFSIEVGLCKKDLWCSLRYLFGIYWT